jgi:DNA polymerase
VIVRLASEADFDGFRQQARALLAGRVPPEAVEFTVAGAGGGLFDEAQGPAAPAAPGAPVPRLDAALLGTLGQAALHREPQRHGLIYRLLWRVAQQPSLRHDPLDADRVRLEAMARAVRRDLHKMKAFVRFREVAEPGSARPLHVAWFEPEHHIEDAIAPFFVRRFAGMRWAILTPRRSLRWDGRSLHHGPGAATADAPAADAGEALWLTYYASIFNPARLKLAAMENEMPRKYWKNLPEAALIAPLAAAATPRTGAMVQAEGTLARRRIPLAARAPDVPAAPPRPVFVAPPAEAGLAARTAALQERRRAAEACRDCPIGAHATQAVHGEGPMDAPLMLVGEQPGDIEDLRGRPFVGPAGRLLDRALAVLGWPRETLYLGNAVRHFKYEPRGKRRIHKTPSQQEAAACEHWLDEEIALVRPQALVALGATAARALLNRPVAVVAERGTWHRHPASGRPVLVTLHPSALLRADAADREAVFARWVDDLRLARQPPSA